MEVGPPFLNKTAKINSGQLIIKKEDHFTKKNCIKFGCKIIMFKFWNSNVIGPFRLSEICRHTNGSFQSE